MKTIKLELEANSIRPYKTASLLILIFGFGFCFLTAYLPQIEQSAYFLKIRGGIPLPIDFSIFREWNCFISMLSLLFAATFGVLSAVMHAKFTIEKQTAKEEIQLCSHQINRSKIMFAKCSTVFFFTVIVSALCNVLAISMFALFSNVFHILPELFTAEMWPKLFAEAGVSALLAAAIGLIAMRVGFWRRSMTASVLTSLLLIIPFSNIIWIIVENPFQARLMGTAILLILGIAMFLELLSKLDKMEVR